MFTQPKDPQASVRRETWVCTVLFVLFLLLGSVLFASAQTYTFTDLGTFEPCAIAGDWVVGVEHGLPTRLNLATGDKRTLGGNGGVAESVIATGEAVGTSLVNGQSVATFWDADGTAVLMPGPTPSDAQDLNDAGVVAANRPCALPNGQVSSQAVRWHPAQGQVECLTGSPSPGVASAIDGHDRVWGRISNVVTVWEVGQPGRPLVQEGGAQGLLNDANETVALGSAENLGATGTARFGRLAVHFQAQGPITSLPAPVDHRTNCAATGANAGGATVGGCSRASESPSHAMLWPDPANLVDLNTRVQAPYLLSTARGISDAGEIVGVSPEGFWLLTPLAPRLFAAGQCGGTVPCRCGDTVVANYVMPDHLGCALNGPFEAALVISSGVEVTNPNGYVLWGTGEGTGILFDGTHSSRVQLHVTGFRHGLWFRAYADGNTYHSSVTHSNREYGLIMTEGANSNMVSNVSSAFNGVSSLTIVGGFCRKFAFREF